MSHQTGTKSPCASAHPVSVRTKRENPVRLVRVRGPDLLPVHQPVVTLDPHPWSAHSPDQTPHPAPNTPDTSEFPPAQSAADTAASAHVIPKCSNAGPSIQMPKALQRRPRVHSRPSPAGNIFLLIPVQPRATVLNRPGRHGVALGRRNAPTRPSAQSEVKTSNPCPPQQMRLLCAHASVTHLLRTVLFQPRHAGPREKPRRSDCSLILISSLGTVASHFADIQFRMCRIAFRGNRD